MSTRITFARLWPVFFLLCVSVTSSSSSSSGPAHGLHLVPPPSRQQLMAQLNFTSAPPTEEHTPRAPNHHHHQQRQPTMSKSFLDIFRPRHPPPRRGPLPIPYPGSPILRPQPPFSPHTNPSPHLTLAPPPPPTTTHLLGKDRIGAGGPVNNAPTANMFTQEDDGQQQQQLESGFLPSKRLHGSSQPVNSSMVQLPPPKALCDFYTDSLCIESYPYPYAEMQRSFPMELPALRRLLTDVQQQNAELLTDGVSIQDEALYTFEHYYGSGENNSHSYKDYGAEGGFVCPSDIRYVRLKRARNPRGQWKTIVNLGDPTFTQTIRIEKCLKPFSRCSYVFSYLSSECVQIYNYQRLAAWDQMAGFHMDIFKIPVSCSCHLRSSSNLRPTSTAAVHHNHHHTPTSPSADFHVGFNASQKRADAERKLHRKPHLLPRPTAIKPSRFLAQDVRTPSFRLRVHNFKPPAQQQQPQQKEVASAGSPHSNRFQPQMMIGHRQADALDRVNFEVNPVSDYMHAWGRRR